MSQNKINRIFDVMAHCATLPPPRFGAQDFALLRPLYEEAHDRRIERGSMDDLKEEWRIFSAGLSRPWPVKLFDFC